MANAKKCDRCGEFYEKNVRYELTAGGRKTVIDGVCKTTSNECTVDYMDLCDDCLSALDNFLNMVEVE
jgi:hypothetical protein